MIGESGVRIGASYVQAPPLLDYLGVPPAARAARPVSAAIVYNNTRIQYHINNKFSAVIN